MLFSGKIPFHIAATLTPRFWVPHLLRFASIRDCSPLFALFETIRIIRTIRYSLFAIRDYSLFAIRDYSLFAIRVFQTPDLGGCYPPRPSVVNTLLDLQNSSYPTQPKSIIAKYFPDYIEAEK